MSAPNPNPIVASAYMKLAQIVTDIKEEKISTTDAIKKIQLREGAVAGAHPSRPYAKVTKNGAVALYGIAKEPIILYESQWNRLQKTVESGYLKKYMEYNKERISHSKPGAGAAKAQTKATSPAEQTSSSESNLVEEVVGKDTVEVDVETEPSASADDIIKE